MKLSGKIILAFLKLADDARSQLSAEPMIGDMNGAINEPDKFEVSEPF